VLSVLIDARNVLRSTWPNIPEQQLVDLCRGWAEENGRRAVVVFDGEAPGGLVGRRQLDDHCLLIGSGKESADAWIEREAAELAARETTYWLVTSDRALRAAAGGQAARIIGGGSFARTVG
jgi:predicted RNA-binding protein with PIN domain